MVDATFPTWVMPGVGEGVSVTPGVTATVGVAVAGVAATVGVAVAGVAATVGVAVAGVAATVGVAVSGVAATVGVAVAGVAATVGVAVPGVTATVGVLVGSGVNVGGRCSRLMVGSVGAIITWAGTTGGLIQLIASSVNGTTIIKILTAIANSSQIVHGAGARPRVGGS